MKKRNAARAVVLLLALACLLAVLPVRAEAAPMNIVVGVKGKCPPYQFLDENGQPKGLHIDIMNRVAELEDIIVTYAVFDTSEEATAALRARKVDAVLGVLADGQLGGEMAMTNSISSGSVALITTKEKEPWVTAEGADVPLFRSAFELGTIDFSQASQLSTRLTVVAGDQIQLFRQLTDGDVDAVIGVKESILYQRQQNGLADDALVSVNNYMGRVQYTIMVLRSNLMLYSRLESGVAQLRNSDEYDSMLRKWITDENLEEARLRIEKLLEMIAVILVLAGGGLVIFNVWNRKLKQMVKDKTEEIRCQMERLEEAGTLQKLLIEHFPNSILILHQDGTLLLMNPRAERAAGIDAVAWHEPAHQSLHVSQLHLFGKIWETTREESGGMVSSAILPVTTEDRRELQVRYQYYQLNQQGDSVLLVEDVTEEETRRKEVFEANKNEMLNRLIAGIAHEIKNPLMSIQAFASVMREQGSDPEFQESFARYVPQEVNRINRLVESLINYAKPAKGIKERVDVQQLMRESVYLISAAVKTKKLTLVCAEGPAVFIQVDRDQIKQALLNLLINSIESVEERWAETADAHAAITLSSGCEDGLVRLSVRDNGVGMSEGSIRNCIEPFYTTKKTGTGMGLSLAQQYVSENGGQFRIASEMNAYTEIAMYFKEDIEA